MSGLTDEQLRLRKDRVGCSELAAIMGYDPWRNAADVFWQKKGEQKVRETEAMRRGRLFEPVILDMAEEELSDKIIDRGSTVLHDDLPMLATLDGRTSGSLEPVEAKMSSQVDLWGPSWSDQVPTHYYIQVQGQMFCTRTEAACVAALLKNYDFRIYIIKRNNAVCESIATAVDWFVSRHLEKDRPPELAPKLLSTLQTIPRTPGKKTVVSDSLVKNLMDVRLHLQKLKKLEEDLKRNLLHELGDCEVGESSYGNVYVRSFKRRAYTVAESEVRRLILPTIRQDEKEDDHARS